MTNYLKALVLLAALTALFILIGIGLGDTTGMWFALALALTVNGYAYWHGPALLIAAHGAIEIDTAAAPDLVDLVEGLAQSASVPTPKLFVSEDSQPNAFSICRARKDAVIVLTLPLLEILTKDEIAGVLSHELAHIRSHDALTMTISVTIVGAITALFAPLILVGRYMRSGKVASIIIVAAIALLAAALLQLVLSRSREYEADKSGAMICGILNGSPPHF